MHVALQTHEACTGAATQLAGFLYECHEAEPVSDSIEDGNFIANGNLIRVDGLPNPFDIMASQP